MAEEKGVQQQESRSVANSPLLLLSLGGAVFVLSALLAASVGLNYQQAGAFRDLLLASDCFHPSTGGAPGASIIYSPQTRRQLSGTTPIPEYNVYDDIKCECPDLGKC